MILLFNECKGANVIYIFCFLKVHYEPKAEQAFIGIWNWELMALVDGISPEGLT